MGEWGRDVGGTERREELALLFPWSISKLGVSFPVSDRETDTKIINIWRRHGIGFKSKDSNLKSTNCWICNLRQVTELPGASLSPSVSWG